MFLTKGMYHYQYELSTDHWFKSCKLLLSFSLTSLMIILKVSMVFGVPPIVCFVVLVPYELTQEKPNGGVFMTATTVFVMVRLGFENNRHV